MARALFADLLGRADPLNLTVQREVLLDQLHALPIPTLLIWGEDDYVLPAHHPQAAVNRLPRGRLSLFYDCGHLPHVEYLG
jgi:pimeloyl-ACP methyl ester carboxylesterase